MINEQPEPRYTEKLTVPMWNFLLNINKVSKNFDWTRTENSNAWTLIPPLKFELSYFEQNLRKICSSDETLIFARTIISSVGPPSPKERARRAVMIFDFACVFEKLHYGRKHRRELLYQLSSPTSLLIYLNFPSGNVRLKYPILKNLILKEKRKAHEFK